MAITALAATSRCASARAARPLALAQAHETRARLIAAHPALAAPGAIEICVIKTTGDKVQDRPLSEIGGKGLFTKEIEEALLAGAIDLAVHSDEGRADLAARRAGDRLPAAARGPARRADLADRAAVPSPPCPRAPWSAARPCAAPAQVKALRPDLAIVSAARQCRDPHRQGRSAAMRSPPCWRWPGLKRLGKEEAATAILSTDEILPAVAQGAIGLETRAGDDRVKAAAGAAQRRGDRDCA